ncbi:MAG: PadR family transcriptional regulator [Acidimicrobiia bacterium]|nr:PadR family transcriptional regulator [Acidimicrobiia bacterium]
MSIRHAALAEIAESPGHSYAIYQRLHARIGDWWGVTPGAVTDALRRAERDGLLVTKRDTRGREVFHIADAGRTALREWNSEVTTPDPAYRNEVLLRVLLFGEHPTEDLVFAVEDMLFKLTARRREMSRLRDESAEIDTPAARLRELILGATLAHLDADAEALRGALRTFEDAR